MTSLVEFAATVVVTRGFLELAGYPQLGNSVLHIAHAHRTRRLPGPLYLVDEQGHRYPLEFDCARYEMKVLY